MQTRTHSHTMKTITFRDGSQSTGDQFKIRKKFKQKVSSEVRYLIIFRLPGSKNQKIQSKYSLSKKTNARTLQ